MEPYCSIQLFNPLPPSDAVGKQKKYFRRSLQFSIVTIQKYHTSGNLIFNYFRIFQILKLRILMEKSFQFLLTHYRPAMPFGNKNLFWTIFSVQYCHN